MGCGAGDRLTFKTVAHSLTDFAGNDLFLDRAQLVEVVAPGLRVDDLRDTRNPVTCRLGDLLPFQPFVVEQDHLIVGERIRNCTKANDLVGGGQFRDQEERTRGGNFRWACCQHRLKVAG